MGPAGTVRVDSGDRRLRGSWWFSDPVVAVVVSGLVAGVALLGVRFNPYFVSGGDYFGFDPRGGAWLYLSAAAVYLASIAGIVYVAAGVAHRRRRGQADLISRGASFTAFEVAAAGTILLFVLFAIQQIVTAVAHDIGISGSEYVFRINRFNIRRFSLYPYLVIVLPAAGFTYLLNGRSGRLFPDASSRVSSGVAILVRGLLVGCALMVVAMLFVELFILPLELPPPLMEGI